MSPTGKITFCPIHEHESKAIEIIQEKGWKEDLEKYEDMNYLHDACDYLHCRRNYIRYMDWGTIKRWVIKHTPTKRQEQRIFDLENNFSSQ